MTIRHLLSMTSGLHDYDDDQMYQVLLDTNGSLPGPGPMQYIDNMLEVEGNELHCDPGTCYSYSSNGFIFAGFVLADLTGTSWRELDLKALALGSVPYQDEFEGIEFAQEGKLCSEYGNLTEGVNKVVHQWSPDGVDLLDYPCLNGWVMGNLMGDAEAILNFYYHLFVERDLLDADAVDSFLNSTVNAKYGMATELYSNFQKGLDSRYMYAGHSGTDWGSESRWAGAILPKQEDGISRPFAFTLQTNDLYTRGNDAVDLLNSAGLHMVNAIVEFLEIENN